MVALERVTCAIRMMIHCCLFCIKPRFHYKNVKSTSASCFYTFAEEKHHCLVQPNFNSLMKNAS